MKKIKIIFLASNNKINIQINNVIKCLNFKSLDVEIVYTHDKNIKKKLSFFNLLLSFIFFIEKNFFYNSEFIKKKKNVTIKKKNISLNSFIRILTNFDKKYFTDLIIDLSNHNVPNKVIEKCKYGFWYINYAEKNNLFIGFWECLFNYKITTTHLFSKIYKDNKIINSCLDTYYLNNKINSWIRNREFITLKSSNLITKNLNRINHNLKFKNTNPPKINLYPSIKITTLLRYILTKYFFYLFKRLFTKINFLNKNVWKIYLFNSNLKNFLSKNKIFEKTHTINPIYNFESADPFIYEYNNINYIFYENNDLKLNKGKISCGILKDNKLTDIKDILNFKYHLSYPFIWKSKKNIFLIPESSQNKSIQIWKSKVFPYKWKLYKTIFNNEFCCDTTIIKGFNNENWLLTNKSNDQTNDPNNELYIYKMIGDFEKFIPHKLNPVVTDCRIARNAGILKFTNMILRPSQINNSYGYGIGLNINKIISLSIENFKEITIKKILPNKKTNATGLHHISNTKSKIVMDIREKFNI
jgi:hypothetical protein